MGSNSSDDKRTRSDAVKYRIRWGNAALALAGLAALILALTLPAGEDERRTSRAQDDFWAGSDAGPTPSPAPTGPITTVRKSPTHPLSRTRERTHKRRKQRKQPKRSAAKGETKIPPSGSAPATTAPNPQHADPGPAPAPDSVGHEFGL